MVSSLSLVLPLSYSNPEEGLAIRKDGKNRSNCRTSSNLARPRKKANNKQKVPKEATRAKCMPSTGLLFDGTITQNNKNSHDSEITKNRSPSTTPLRGQCQREIINEGEEKNISTNAPQLNGCPGDGQTHEIQHLISELRSILTSDETNVPQSQSTIELDYEHDIKSIGVRIREEDSKVTLFCNKQRDRFLRRQFVAWREATLSRGRHALHKELDSLRVYKLRKRGILAALSAVAIGADSRKTILKRRPEALDKARTALTEKLALKNQLHGGIISTCMLQNELRRLFHDELHQWDRKRYLKGPFLVMKTAMENTKQGRVKAYTHYCRTCLEKTFSKWYDCTRVGTRRAPRFDQDRVDLFSRTTLIKIPFKQWHTISRMLTEAAKKRRAALTRFIHSYFMAWQNQARNNRLLKIKVFQNWRHYEDIVRTKPFYKWHEWAVNKRKRRRDNERFLNSHQRIKNRRILFKAFRHWSHQMAYGSVSALYTRYELIQKVKQQSKRIGELEDETQINHDRDLQITTSISQLQEELNKKEEEMKILTVSLKKAKEERDGAQSLVTLSHIDRESLRMASSRHMFCAQW